MSAMDVARGARSGGTAERVASRNGGIRQIYPANGQAVAEARTHVTGWLRAEGADEVMIGDIAVAVSEACTNAVMHAYQSPNGDVPGGGDGRLAVVADRTGETVTVTVEDTGAGVRPRPDSPGMGLGFAIVASLCDHVEMRTGPGGTGTVVEMKFTPEGSRRRTIAH
jgi:serine/threonine-protein kinase RsbW